MAIVDDVERSRLVVVVPTEDRIIFATACCDAFGSQIDMVEGSLLRAGNYWAVECRSRLNWTMTNH